MRTYVLLALIMLASCSTEQLTKEQQDYKKYCQETGGAWMKMSELKEGIPTGRTCYGCMPDEANHLCDRAEYEVFEK